MAASAGLGWQVKPVWQYAGPGRFNLTLGSFAVGAVVRDSRGWRWVDANGYGFARRYPTWTEAMQADEARKRTAA